MTRRRILIVDDDPGILHAMQRVLERSHEVVTAGSADEAVERMAAARPDLAIVDVRMPGVDGFALMGQLKHALPHLDVILMTGSVGDTDRKLVRAIREKAFYFIRKPFDREVLLTLVERCLELRRLEETNRRHLERLEAEMAQARSFQQSLFPARQARAGRVELEARVVACDELCGDLYDWVACGRDRLAFLVADVSGHGASAAMLTGVVKSAFRSCHDSDYAPETVARAVSAGLGAFLPNRFVTLFCGRLDAAAGRLSYVNAGHPPGIAWKAGEMPLRLDPTGPLISPALVDSCWREEQLAWPPGWRLLLVTDGVIESQGGAEELGIEGLERVAIGCPTGTLLDDVVRAAEVARAGRPARDDLTLVTVWTRA